tara:strand:- start:1820 stop:2239 length:420 start_codon:yes stop_codon:yes gene_type:complete
MKKILIIIVLLFSANSYADDIKLYKHALNKCDEVAEKKGSEAVTTHDMKQVGYNLTKCYQNVGEDIIDKYYSKNAKDIKARLDKFINLTFDLNSDVYEKRDYCVPTCGTMYQVLYVDQSAKVLRRVIEDMIKAIDYNEM